MNAFPHILLACLLAGSSALAGVPERQAKGLDYPYDLNNSPITSPAKEVVTLERDPLADWALAGVAEVPGGYRVTLSHRQKSGERMTLRSADQEGGVQIERVEFGKDWRDTVVHVSSAGRSSALRFDPAAMVPAAKPATAAAAPSNSPKIPAPAGSIAPKAPAAHPH